MKLRVRQQMMRHNFHKQTAVKLTGNQCRPPPSSTLYTELTLTYEVAKQNVDASSKSNLLYAAPLNFSAVVEQKNNDGVVEKFLTNSTY